MHFSTTRLHLSETKWISAEGFGFCDIYIGDGVGVWFASRGWKMRRHLGFGIMFIRPRLEREVISSTDFFSLASFNVRETGGS